MFYKNILQGLQGLHENKYIHALKNRNQMPNIYRYILDKSSKQFICPNPECGQKRFKRYIDIETKLYLPEKYGKCNRIDNCRYHLNPYKDGYGTEDNKEYSGKPLPPVMPQPVYFMPEIVLNATLKAESYNNNTFILNLMRICPTEDIAKVISLYRIGTISKGERAGAVTFPFIDFEGNIRTIQAKQFNDANHTLKNGTDFVHSILVRHFMKKCEALPDWLNEYTKNEKFVSCLFGEHLLSKYHSNPIALVEAPKTAIIATLYFGLPNDPTSLLWLAVYNKSSLTVEKCKVLKGKNIVLFPDLNAYDEWFRKAQELESKISGTRFLVDDRLEKNASENERKQGLDLADYLTRFKYLDFIQERK